MSEIELINWFNEKLMNCYHIVKDDGNIIWVYDKNYVRKKKLAEIESREIELPVYDRSKVLFYQDKRYKYFNCCYVKIWRFLEDNYSSDYDDIKSFIKDRLNSIQNLKKFTNEFELVPADSDSVVSLKSGKHLKIF